MTDHDSNEFPTQKGKQIMSTKVCQWCGQPLNHRGEPPEYAETCEQVYGEKCQNELNHLAQMQHEFESWQDEQEDKQS